MDGIQVIFSFLFFLFFCFLSYRGGFVVEKQYLAIFQIPSTFLDTNSSWFASGPPPPFFTIVVPADAVRANAHVSVTGTTSMISNSTERVIMLKTVSYAAWTAWVPTAVGKCWAMKTPSAV